MTIQSEHTGEDICISIHDTGPDIAPEHLPHLFKRFYLVEVGRTHSTGGTSLGLVIAYEITRMHGGSLKLLSTIQQGTTALVRLPNGSLSTLLVNNQAVVSQTLGMQHGFTSLQNARRRFSQPRIRQQRLRRVKGGGHDKPHPPKSPGKSVLRIIRSVRTVMIMVVSQAIALKMRPLT